MLFLAGAVVLELNFIIYSPSLFVSFFFVKKYVNTAVHKFVNNKNTVSNIFSLLNTAINNNATNEVDKIFLYKSDDKIINRNDVNEITIDNIEEEIYLLSEAVIVGNTDRALSLYRKFINNGYDELSIITLLANQFRFLLQVKTLYDKGMDANGISREIDAHPFRVQKTIPKIYSYTKEELANYLSYLFDLDSGIKTGKIDKGLGIELFIINKDIANYNKG